MFVYIRNKKIRNSLNYFTKAILGMELFFPRIPSDNRILFFKRDRKHFEFLSNFYLAEFVLSGILWPSVEHYYQYHKSEKPEYKSAILNAKNAAEVKQLSDSRIGNEWQFDKSWFKENPEDLRSDWDDIKDQVMEKAVKEKFRQNPYLKKRLLATRNAEIIEDAKWDFYWGIGHDGSGDNRLGKLLMTIREK